MAFLPVLAGIGSALGGYFGGEAQAGAAREAAERSERLGMAQLEEQKRQAKLREEAYKQALEKAGGMAAGGEEMFLSEAGKSPAELEAMRQNILSGEAEALQAGAGQLQAGLAQQGVRGGQAATQLKRGIGEMATTAQRDITGLMGQEAMQRAAEKRAYAQQKAFLGQRGLVAGY